MMKRHIPLLALPLFSIAACLDMSGQDSTDGSSSQAAGAAALAGSPQAAATITNRICETNGSFCVGAPTIAFEDPVVETTGGRIFQIQTSGGFVLLAFNADPTRCVAVKNGSTNTDGLVEVRACSGVPSALWVPQRGPDGQSCIFQNQLGLYLSGRNMGTQFHVRAKGEGGWFQQFMNPGISCP